MLPVVLSFHASWGRSLVLPDLLSPHIGSDGAVALVGAFSLGRNLKKKLKFHSWLRLL